MIYVSRYSQGRLFDGLGNYEIVHEKMRDHRTGRILLIHGERIFSRLFSVYVLIKLCTCPERFFSSPYQWPFTPALFVKISHSN